jgi:hypothetical protein
MLPKWFCCCFRQDTSGSEKLVLYKNQYRIEASNYNGIPFYIKRFKSHFRRPSNTSV